MLFSQTGYVPDAHGLIEGCRDNQIILWVELRAHSIMIMSRHAAYLCAILPIPYSDRLIIGTREDPREFVVEKHGPHVVKMP
jgi:hypothetical protein